MISNANALKNPKATPVGNVMSQASHHLIHANIALVRGDFSDEKMSGFVQQIEEINHLASLANGFVSELTALEGDSVYDGRWLLNVSAWESVESLAAFTYSGLHAVALKNRRSWFEKQAQANYVLFWFPVGGPPTETEIKKRLDFLIVNGQSAYAFNFKERFSLVTTLKS